MENFNKVESKLQEKIANIQQLTGGKYGPKEIEDFIASASVLVSKPLLTALKAVVQGGDPQMAQVICDKIDKVMPYNYCGYASINFKPSETDMTLHVALSLVNKDYKSEVLLPSNDYTADLYNIYDFIKSSAIAYWRTFSDQNPKLIEQIAAHRSDIDFNELLIDDDSKTTLYWDPACEKRMGLFCYYLDKKGQPFYKK